MSLGNKKSSHIVEGLINIETATLVQPLVCQILKFQNY